MASMICPFLLLPAALFFLQLNCFHPFSCALSFKTEEQPEFGQELMDTKASLL